MRMPPASVVAVEIVQAPIGEAPDWVREAWVGLRLPVMDCRPSFSFGVLSGPRSWIGQWMAILTGRAERVEGYWVESAGAIALLERIRPDAAAWWRGHVPEFSKPGRVFVFDLPACNPVA